jgi:type II secretory pathway component GspD/PulD (secretin)
VRVAALPDTNDVIVQGPPDRLALAEQLIKTFDVEGAGGGPSGIVIVQLKNAMAASLAEAVNASLAAPARATARRGGPGAGATDQVTVTAETNANAVLVRGPSA